MFGELTLGLWSSYITSVVSSVFTEWTGTATVKHNSPGLISFKTSRVEMTATGTARISVIRHGGFNGAVSVDIATLSTTGDIAMTAGVHFTAMSETVSYADGEAGEKYVDVTVGTAPAAGLHLFVVEMTNATGSVAIQHPIMHVYYDNGSPNTSATSVTAATDVSAVSIASPAQLTVADSSVFKTGQGSLLSGFSTTPDINGLQTITIVDSTHISIPVNVTAVADGVGLATDAVLETTANAAASGDLIYLRSTDGDYFYNYRTSGQQYGGVSISNTSGTKTAPIVIRNYPGETPKIDQLLAGTHDDAGLDITCGFILLTGVDYFHIGGIEITGSLGSGAMSVDPTANVVVEDMHIHDLAKTPIASYSVAVGADNIGGIRLDGAVDPIFRNNHIHNIYDPRVSTGLSNPFDAEPYSLHSGIHGYRLKSAWCHNNKIYVTGYGIYNKNPYQATAGGDDGHHVHHNLFYNIVNHGFLIDAAGSGQEPGHNYIIHHNVIELDDTTGNDVSLFQVDFGADVTAQPVNLHAYSNTQIGGDWFYYAKSMDYIVAYNNILQNGKNNLAIERDLTYDTHIDYNDYNCFNNITSTLFLTSRNGTSTSYTSLGSWQTAYSVGLDDQLYRDPDNNSITTAPTFVDSANKDYTTVSGVTVGAGRFGRDIGIGTEVAGNI